MQSNRIAIILALISLTLSIVTMFRNPFERYVQFQKTNCDNQQGYCNEMCEMKKQMELSTLSIDSNMHIFQRNQDLSSCNIRFQNNPAQIQQCQDKVNAEFQNYLGLLAVRKEMAQAHYIVCIDSCISIHSECYNNIKMQPLITRQ